MADTDITALIRALLNRAQDANERDYKSENALYGNAQTTPPMSETPKLDLISAGLLGGLGAAEMAVGGGMAGVGGLGIPLGLLVGSAGLSQTADAGRLGIPALQQLYGSHPQQRAQEYWQDQLDLARNSTSNQYRQR